MRRSRVSSALLIFLTAAATGAGVAVGCSATSDPRVFSGGGGDATSSSSTNGGNGGAVNVGGGGGTGNDDGFGGLDDPGDGGPTDASPDVPMNPCGTECGPLELCDADHLGLDDDCDGEVDEVCSCTTGQAHACFKGDPSYRAAEGCFPGTERCDESGDWGPCLGGVHATELCYANSAAGCHPIQAAPFADVNLKDGTGSFSGDAVAGTERWEVTCPAGVDPCPAVDGTSPPDDFKPLQSGEYTVRYTKGVAGGTTQTCEYPLFVGAPGLRVELEWEHTLGSVDLDLHLHKPNNTQPWTISGSDVDCGYGNCTINSFSASSAINWFSDSATPPDPVNWYLDPVDSNNTCFFSPRGAGARWRANGRGCHSPRLDIDNITCNPSSTNPDDGNFCAPENINIDYPPSDQWMRVGVHYFSGSPSGDIHPRVKIFCNGALGGELGSAGFYDPERPVAFAPSDSGTRAWLVADVIFSEATECSSATCIVQPLYENAATKTPLLTTRSFIESNFGPAYPPAP
jgi:hypothetical protein